MTDHPEELGSNTVLLVIIFIIISGCCATLLKGLKAVGTHVFAGIDIDVVLRIINDKSDKIVKVNFSILNCLLIQ